MNEGIILFVVPAAAFLATLLQTYWFGKRQSRTGLVGFGVVWVAFTGVMFFGMENAHGWDGLGYLLALLGISAPSGVAALIGGLVGWAKNEKAIHA